MKFDPFRESLMMSLEDKKENLLELKLLIERYGGNKNVRSLQEGIEEIEQCLRDLVESEKELALEDIKNMYFDEAFGDLHDCIRQEREQREEEVVKLRAEYEEKIEIIMQEKGELEN